MYHSSDTSTPVRNVKEASGAPAAVMNVVQRRTTPTATIVRPTKTTEAAVAGEGYKL